MPSKIRSKRGATSFTLIKWYFDCVDRDGRAVIGYWASIAWGRPALTWQSVVLYEPGRSPLRRTSLASAREPELRNDSITWRVPSLGCLIDVRSTLPPIRSRLLEDDSGVVDWCAVAPAADVSVELRGSAPVQGPGYAERIEMNVLPWHLPIRELRWGRWLDQTSSRSVVWIDWRGRSPRSWVFVDGILDPSAVVTDEGVSASGATLVIGVRRVLEQLTFSQIAATIPALEAVVPASLLALSQTKWSSEGTLQAGGSTMLEGRAIHELVVF